MVNRVELHRDIEKAMDDIIIKYKEQMGIEGGVASLRTAMEYNHKIAGLIWITGNLIEELEQTSSNK